MRAVWLLVLVAGCGTLPLTGSDGGDDDDGALPDVAVSDVAVDAPADATVKDAGKDSTIPKDATADSAGDATLDSAMEAASDATVEASCYSDAGAPDAFVDLDAATAGWGAAPIYGALVGVAADSNGNVLVGGVNIPSTSQIFYLQELSSNGTSLWTRSPSSSTGVSSVNDVAFDVWGNAYAAAYTTGTIDVGGGAIGPGAFIVKYDPQGNFVWEYGPFANTTFNKLRTQSSGVVVAVGTITGAEDYGGGTLTPVGGGKAVLVQLSSCESFIRAKMWGGTNGAQEIRQLAVGPSDELFISGTFQDSIDFGGGTMSGPTNTSNVNLFIAKLDANGAYAHQMDTQCNTDPGYTTISGLSADSAGNVFVVGGNRNSINLGNGTMTAIGQSDIVIGKLDSSLSAKWASHFGKAVTCVASAGAVAADPTGAVVMAGAYSGCDGMTFTGDAGVPNGQNFFMARFDSSGTALTTFGTGNTTGFGAPNAMAFVTWPDFIVAGGQCGGNMTFPYGTLTCGSSGKGFAVRLPP